MGAVQKPNDCNVVSFPRIQWRIIHSHLKRDIIKKYGGEWKGLGKCKCIIFGKLFCILNKQFMIRLPLISAYFEQSCPIGNQNQNKSLDSASSRIIKEKCINIWNRKGPFNQGAHFHARGHSIPSGALHNAYLRPRLCLWPNPIYAYGGSSYQQRASHRITKHPCAIRGSSNRRHHRPAGGS